MGYDVPNVLPLNTRNISAQINEIKNEINNEINVRFESLVGLVKGCFGR